jgi:hypothetical protein
MGIIGASTENLRSSSQQFSCISLQYVHVPVSSLLQMEYLLMVSSVSPLFRVALRFGHLPFHTCIHALFGLTGDSVDEDSEDM